MDEFLAEKDEENMETASVRPTLAETREVGQVAGHNTKTPRYCEMCDEWTKYRECPQCGADTRRA